MSSPDKNDSKVNMKQSDLRDKEAKYAISANRGALADSLGEQRSDIAGINCIEGAHDVSARSQKKTQKLKRHFRRFWFYYVLLGVILSAIFLPILFLVIVPAVAQRAVNNSKLAITEAQIMQPRPDSIQLTLLTALNLGGLSVYMDATTLSLFDTQLNRPFAELYLPAKKLHGNTTFGTVNQSTPITDQEGWQAFVDNAVNPGTESAAIKGTSVVHLGKLHAKLKINKKIPSNGSGLNQFKGFSIENSTFLPQPEADGTNVIANVTLQNPSVITIEIGDVTIDLLSGDLVIGNATINDLIIRPGNQTSLVRGVLDLQKIAQNLPSIIYTQRTAIENGYLELSSKGASVTYEGVTVPYYENVLTNLSLTQQVPIIGLLADTLRGVTQSSASALIPLLNLTDSLVDV